MANEKQVDMFGNSFHIRIWPWHFTTGKGHTVVEVPTAFLLLTGRRCLCQKQIYESGESTDSFGLEAARIQKGDLIIPTPEGLLITPTLV